MTTSHPIVGVLERHCRDFHPLVAFDPKNEKMIPLDLSEANSHFTSGIFADTKDFTAAIMRHMSDRAAKFAVGGYAELRGMYAKSTVFDPVGEEVEPRRMHLGLDIWGSAGTPVLAPLEGVLHSAAMNGSDGDYGSTLVFEHELDGISFHTLYGHLSASDQTFRKGDPIGKGGVIGHFGEPHENGNWPPHLHFQIVIDMELKEGDYPGVCRYSERGRYLRNCPDPELISQIKRYLHV